MITFSVKTRDVSECTHRGTITAHHCHEYVLDGSQGLTCKRQTWQNQTLQDVFFFFRWESTEINRPLLKEVTAFNTKNAIWITLTTSIITWQLKMWGERAGENWPRMGSSIKAHKTSNLFSMFKRLCAHYLTWHSRTLYFVHIVNLWIFVIKIENGSSIRAP